MGTRRAIARLEQLPLYPGIDPPSALAQQGDALLPVDNLCKCFGCTPGSSVSTISLYADRNRDYLRGWNDALAWVAGMLGRTVTGLARKR